MSLQDFKNRVNNSSEELNNDIDFSMDILDRIHELLEKKFDGKQKLLAAKMGKSESEVSKWLSGVQNFTIKTINRLSEAFGEPIIAVCTNSEDNSTFELVKTCGSISAKSLICTSAIGEVTINVNSDEESYVPMDNFRKTTLEA